MLSQLSYRRNVVTLLPSARKQKQKRDFIQVALMGVKAHGMNTPFLTLDASQE
jgi:hypothetical protein